MHRAALFDAGDTLVHWGVHKRDRFAWVCESAGICLPVNDAARLAAARATELFFYSHLNRPDSWTTEWWTEMYAVGLAELGLPDDLAPRIAAHRGSLPPTWWLDPDAVPVLTALRQRGYKIGLVSNWDGTLATLCAEWGLTEHLDYIGDSTVFGERKPSVAFFRHVQNELGVAPEAAFHVGDTYDADVAGARAAGITPILLDSLGCEKRTCDYRIAGLRDVLAVLDRLP
jgi:putative hydrolase of the HAD superfamily